MVQRQASVGFTFNPLQHSSCVLLSARPLSSQLSSLSRLPLCGPTQLRSCCVPLYLPGPAAALAPERQTVMDGSVRGRLWKTLSDGETLLCFTHALTVSHLVQGRLPQASTGGAGSNKVMWLDRANTRPGTPVRVRLKVFKVKPKADPAEVKFYGLLKCRLYCCPLWTVRS